MVSQLNIAEIVGVSGLFIVSFILSTLIIRRAIPLLSDDGPEQTSDQEQDPGLIGLLPESSSASTFDLRSTGFWIGFCETFLIFTLVYAQAFSALAIIIGAKQFVRNEKINLRPSYYLLGTLVNLMVAILFALIASSLFPSPLMTKA